MVQVEQIVIGTALIGIAVFFYLRRQTQPAYIQLPDLSEIEYIHQPVEFKTSDLILIECFATWCQPCKGQIPHLAALQKKYDALKIISISNENFYTIESFVKGQSEMLQYNVASDPKFTLQNLNNECGVNGIPHCFLFKAGHLFWDGHPSKVDSEIEEALE